ncbi:MAG: BsuPI-related putative proteinase inhibitor [Dehalococcoidia bacterium]
MIALAGIVAIGGLTAGTVMGVRYAAEKVLDEEAPAQQAAGDVVEMATPSPAALGPLRTMDELLGEAGQLAPGFGGMFVDPAENVLYVYLLDLSKKDEAVAAISRVFGPDRIPSGGVKVLQAQYTIAQLSRWYEPMSKLLTIPGITGTDLAEHKNRLKVGVEDIQLKGQVESELDRLGIPREVVLIEDDGRSCQDRISEINQSSPPSHLANLLNLALEATSILRAGETANFKLAVKNISDHPLTLYAGYDRYEFLVTREDRVVWCVFHGGAMPDGLYVLDLQPGQAEEYVAQWEQRDSYKNPLPPGSYFVRGVFTASLTDYPFEWETVKTDSQQLTITK